MNSLWIKFTFFANSLWIQYLFREFKWICSFSRVFAFCYVYSHWILFPFRECTINTKSVSHIHLESTVFRKITMNWLFASWLFSFNPLSFLWNHYEFAMKSLWNHYEITMNSLFVLPFLFELTIFFANSLSVSRIYLESTILFSELLWIYYRFHVITVKTLQKISPF